MNIRLVHVARDGKVLGQYPPEQLSSLLDTGHFFETDICYSEAFPEWTPLPEFLKKVDAPKYARITHGESKKPHRHDRRPKQPPLQLLGGWIAFLLALAALVGAGFWIASLYTMIDEKSARIDTMEKKLVEQARENQKLLFASREIAAPGTVRGSIILRNDGGKRVAVPGCQVFLYKRKNIENYLETKTKETSLLPEGSALNAIEFYFASLPTPVSTTTTDASGRFEFPVSEPGEYVLCVRVNSQAGDGQSSRLWFVAFNSQDPLNSLIEINESNSVQQYVPSLMIVEGR